MSPDQGDIGADIRRYQALNGTVYDYLYQLTLRSMGKVYTEKVIHVHSHCVHHYKVGSEANALVTGSFILTFVEV